jgi:hypothetical protein
MKKRNIFIAVGLIITGAAVYGFIEYNRTAEDLLYVKAKQIVTVSKILSSFATDASGTNKEFLGQVIAIKGVLVDIEEDKNNFIVVLGDGASLSSVRCSMDSTHTETLTGLFKGELITIKGIVAGYNADDTGLLGSDVQMNRCVIDSKQ